MKKDYCKVEGWDVGARVVANDATPEVLAGLKGCGIAHTIYNDPKPNDYYLNRVYRCWNYAGKTSVYENICFVNSDMVFSKDWLANLLKHHDGINIPCSRLVESGKLLSGMHGFSRNFGRTPKEIDFAGWYEFAEKFKQRLPHYGGLYMPCVFQKGRFIESGMYPEGNIYQDGRAGSMVGGVIMSGDDHYFNQVLVKKYGMRHLTVFDSLSYHLQEGEKDA
jgi:hypothetical protein